MKFLNQLIKQSRFSKMGYNLLNARIARRQYIENRDELSKIKLLKNSFKGKRCFIIGTGPSLTISDLEMLQNEYTFGTNRIYELFDQTDWRPTFYVNQDADLIKKFSERIKEVPSKYLFLPIDFKNLFDDERIHHFVLKHKDYYPKKAPFSSDVSRYLSQGFTVTYGAIQIAAYLGFSEIYLLGIDHNYSISRDAKGKPIIQGDSKPNYSQGIKEYSNPKNLPRTVESTLAFDTAEQVSRKMGFRVFNTTRGGKLESFERKKLEEVLNNSQSQL